jgi:hypothetical protein
VIVVALSGCAGGGTNGAASVPGPTTFPPTATQSPTSTGRPTLQLTAGTYEAIAATAERGQTPKGDDARPPYTARILATSGVRLTADPASGTYTIAFAEPGYPASQNFQLDATGSGPPLTQDTSAATAQSYSLDIAPASGLRYVSLGSWFNEPLTRTAGGGYQEDLSAPQNDVFFIVGRRTTPGELPISGTASYTLQGGGVQFHGEDLPEITISTMKLTADFASRRVGASIDQPYRSSIGLGDHLGLSVTGGAPIAQGGDYRIALTGAADAGPGGVRPVSGAFQGAFFGPAAEEAGGALRLQIDGDPLPLFTGDFAGKRD